MAQISCAHAALERKRHVSCSDLRHVPPAVPRCHRLHLLQPQDKGEGEREGLASRLFPGEGLGARTPSGTQSDRWTPTDKIMILFHIFHT